MFNNDIYLKVNTTITIPTWICGGYITGSGNYFGLFVPINIANDVNSVTVIVDGGGTIFGPSSSNRFTSSTAAIVYQFSSKGIYCELKKSFSENSKPGTLLGYNFTITAS